MASNGRPWTRRIAGLLLAGMALAGCSADPPGEAGPSATEPSADANGDHASASGTKPTDPREDPPGEHDGRDSDTRHDDPDAEADLPNRQHAHLHGAWIHLFDGRLKTRDGIDAAVEELADAGATAIVAQVMRRHDAYFDSQVLPRTVDPAVAPGFDVLSELLDAAHARGIQVHAWLSVAPTWHDTYAELTPPTGWLATTHGHLADEADRWVTRDVNGTWSQYLDPALPEVRAHVVEVVRELVARYPIDGIHLDYVRYESERHGYHPRAVADYLDETGASGTPAPDDPAWSQWRRDRTRQFVAEVEDALARDAPDVTLSAAVISWGPGPGHADAPTFADTRAFTEALQDWDGWVRDGLVDAVMPMMYFREHDDEQRAWFGSWVAYAARLAADTDVAVVPGVGGWLNSPEATVSQAVAARAAADGVLIYSYQQPTDDGSRAVWPTLRDADWGSSVP